jgi:AcrR family transcriptional regulator
MDVTRKSPLPPAVPKRRDARRSYDALVAAARVAFELHGLEASLDDIAHAAGVANATLYRHFSSRYELLAVAHADSITSLCERAEWLHKNESGTEALHRWLKDVVDEASQSRGVTAAWKSACSTQDLGIEWCKQALTDACRPLLHKAQCTGAAPAGLSVDDVMRLVTAVALATESDPASSNSARRLLDVVLAGFTAQGATGLAATSPGGGNRRKDQAEPPASPSTAVAKAHEPGAVSRRRSRTPTAAKPVPRRAG